jgi:hypothetical protein
VYAALLLLAGGGRESLSAPAPRSNEQPLPKELVAAWREASARVGWMRIDELALVFREGVVGQRGEVPAFEFRRWTGGVVRQLPPPQRAFGLVLVNTRVTDAGLKELQVLLLFGTQVTDRGAAELQKALPMLTIKR